MKKLLFFWECLKETFSNWNDSPASRDSASLAYYAIFSIPGLLIIIIWIAGNIFGDEAISGEISSQISSVMGTDVATSVQEMIASARIDRENVFMKIIGIFSLVFGATTIFFQLQKALNNIWDVEPAPSKAVMKFVLQRANSLGMILVLGFLLMITMILSSMVSFFNNFISQTLGVETYLLMETVNYTISFLLVVILFAFMFKVLPDINITWRSVWMGAFITAILFTLGKFLLSLYFGTLKPTSTFGKAGTVILIMMWINYSCMLIFLGAQFTKVYAKKKGHEITPSKHAMWTELKQIKLKNQAYLNDLKSKQDSDNIVA